MKKQKVMTQMKGQGKTSEKQLNERREVTFQKKNLEQW